jgi:hypothetical protein
MNQRAAFSHIQIRAQPGVSPARDGLANKIFPLLLKAGVLVLFTLNGCGREPSEPAASRPSVAPRPTSPATDAMLVAQVTSALIADPHVDAKRIDVDSTNDVVTLNGIVDSQQEHTRAVQVARGIAGVKDVNDKLSVASAGPENVVGSSVQPTKSPPAHSAGGRKHARPPRETRG